MFEAIKKLFSSTRQEIVHAHKRGESVCGIDIGSGSIKVVQVKEEHGKIILETYGALPLGPLGGEPIGKPVRVDEMTLAKAINQAMTESRITAKNFVVSFQSQSILVFTVTLPKVTADKLDAIIPTEARKYIPIPISEVSLDWFIIPEKQIGQEAGQSKETIDVLVVAIRNETLDTYNKIVKQAQLPQQSFEIEVFAIMRSVLRREVAPVMIVDVGTSSSSVFVAEYGVMRMFHVINRGSAFVTETIMRGMNVSFEKAEELKFNAVRTPEVQSFIATGNQYLVSEIKRGLLEYERENGRTVSKIILAGGGSTAFQFRDTVANETGIETLLADPFSKVEAPEFLRPLLTESGPQFAVATGLALKHLLPF